MLHTAADELEDPYYLSIRLGIRRAAEAKRLRLTELFCKDFLRESGDLRAYSGVLILGESDRWSPACEELLQRVGVPSVLVDFAAQDSAFDCVYTDPRRIAKTALALFERETPPRIGYLGAAEDSPFSDRPVPDPRQACFCAWQAARGRLRPEDVFTAQGATCDSGYRLAKEALSRSSRPEAFFVMNDSMAIGAYRAIREAGLRIPQDVEVVGCNDIPSSAYLDPPLTTVRLFPVSIGEISLRALLDRIENGREGRLGLRVEVPCEAVVRGSTKTAAD